MQKSTCHFATTAPRARTYAPATTFVSNLSSAETGRPVSPEAEHTPTTMHHHPRSSIAAGSLKQRSPSQPRCSYNQPVHAFFKGQCSLTRLLKLQTKQKHPTNPSNDPPPPSSPVVPPLPASPSPLLRGTILTSTSACSLSGVPPTTTRARPAGPVVAPCLP